MLTKQLSSLGGWSSFCLFPSVLRFTVQGLAAASIRPTGIDHASKQALGGSPVSDWKGRVRLWQNRSKGRREMSQLGNSPEQLPHHWIISTNPSSIFSGQEGFFCFQILRKSLWSKETKACCSDYYKQLNELWPLLLANLFPTDQHGGSGDVCLWRNDQSANKG